MYIKTMTDT